MKNTDLTNMKNCFEEVCGIAYENAPDADESFLSNFRKNMEAAEKEFNEAHKNLSDKIEKYCFYLMKTIKETRKYFLYLEWLRRSGQTNMFGAVPYLVEEFHIPKQKAKDILTDWMNWYDLFCDEFPKEINEGDWNIRDGGI